MHLINISACKNMKLHILGRFEWFIITRAVQFSIRLTVFNCDFNRDSVLPSLFLTKTSVRGDSLLIASDFSVDFAVPKFLF